jgi:hypothetical protein
MDEPRAVTTPGGVHSKTSLESNHNMTTGIENTLPALLEKTAAKFGNPKLLELLPKPFERGQHYMGNVTGGNARMVEISPTKNSPDFVFIEVSCWANGCPGGWQSYTSRAISIEAVPMWLSMCDEFRAVESIEWICKELNPGELEHHQFPGYSRFADFDWMNDIQKRKAKAARRAKP